MMTMHFLVQFLALLAFPTAPECTLLVEFECGNERYPISKIAFSPASTQVVCGTEDGHVACYDYAKYEQLYELKAFDRSVTAIGFFHNKDDNVFAGNSKNGLYEMKPSADGKVESEHFFKEGIKAAFCSSEGIYAAVHSKEARIDLISYQKKTILKTILTDKGERIRSSNPFMESLNQGAGVFGLTVDQSVVLLSEPNFDFFASFSEAESVADNLFMLDNSPLLCFTQNDRLHVFDYRNKRKLRSIPSKSGAFLSGGFLIQEVAIAFVGEQHGEGQSSQIALYNYLTGKHLSEIRMRKTVLTEITKHPTKNVFATGDSEGRLKIWKYSFNK
jgi:WD40 repeat protein